MARESKGDDSVMVIGPVYHNANGDVRQKYPARPMPRKLAESASVKALGITMLKDIDEGLVADPRMEKGLAEADRLRAENMELQRRLAELEAASDSTGKVDLHEVTDLLETPTGHTQDPERVKRKYTKRTHDGGN